MPATAAESSTRFSRRPSRHPGRRPSRRTASARFAVGLLALLLAGVILTACGERAQWVNDAVPEERWGEDRAACRARADDLAARQLDRDLASDQISGDAGSLTNQFAVEDAKALRRKLYQHCLGARGYELKGD